MKNETARVLLMAGAVILLAGLAAYLGLAHGCEKPGEAGRIAGRVAIDPALGSQVSPTDVLFIIVRRPGSSPRPLAVKRVDRPQFPVAFEITNRDVMVPGSELRGMVEILARIDKDGQAGPAQAGDLEGRYEKNPTLAGARDIEIVINQTH